MRRATSDVSRGANRWCMIARIGSALGFHSGGSIPMSMTSARFPVSVVVQCTPLASRWQSERWEPVAVEAAADEPTSASRMPAALDTAGTRWRFNSHAIELHRTEAEGYFLNTTSPEPKVFVMWRMHGTTLGLVIQTREDEK